MSDAADGLTVPGSTDCDGNLLFFVRNRTLAGRLGAGRRTGGEARREAQRVRDAAGVRIVMEIGCFSSETVRSQGGLGQGAEGAAAAPSLYTDSRRFFSASTSKSGGGQDMLSRFNVSMSSSVTANRLYHFLSHGMMCQGA